MMTEDEYVMILRIAGRAMDIGILQPSKGRRFKMDLQFAHEHYNLDLDKFLDFDNMNFAHDVIEIQRHINRESKTFDNCFVPRCTRPPKHEHDDEM